ncbi:hypothetical protein [Aureliella helgolandensis]|nr:hypothetical protein [Aureliella helgolandensis]
MSELYCWLESLLQEEAVNVEPSPPGKETLQDYIRDKERNE